MKQDRQPRPLHPDRSRAAFHPRSDRTPGAPLQLTQAIRPVGGSLPLWREGYRIEGYRDADTGRRWPVLTAALSSEKLIPAFVDLLQPLGDVVDFIIESTHDVPPARQGESPLPITWERQNIDLAVLTSTLYDFEELLVNDGCTGVAVLNSNRQLEVHFDEHKLLYIYGSSLHVFESILQQHQIYREDDLILFTEYEHIHCTLEEYQDRVDDFRQLIGIEDSVESNPHPDRY